MQQWVDAEVQKLCKLFQGLRDQSTVSFELNPPMTFDNVNTQEEMMQILQQRYAFRQAVVAAWNKKYPQLFAFLHADFDSYADKRTFIKIKNG